MSSYYEQNKERILAQRKIYYYNNKEKLREKQKLYAKTDRAKSLQRHSDIKSKQNNFANYIFRSLINRCKVEGRFCNLEKEDIVIPEYCPYLNIKLTNILGKGRQETNPSVDRIIPELGYIKGNIQIISDKANRMKQDATTAELITFANSILKIHSHENYSL